MEMDIPIVRFGILNLQVAYYTGIYALKLHVTAVDHSVNWSVKLYFIVSLNIVIRNCKRCNYRSAIHFSLI